MQQLNQAIEFFCPEWNTWTHFHICESIQAKAVSAPSILTKMENDFIFFLHNFHFKLNVILYTYVDEVYSVAVKVGSRWGNCPMSMILGVTKLREERAKKYCGAKETVEFSLYPENYKNHILIQTRCVSVCCLLIYLYITKYRFIFISVIFFCND